MTDYRVVDLIIWAANERIKLPMSAEEIIALEDQGFVVDLDTGQILTEAEADTLIARLLRPESDNTQWN